MSFIIQSDNQVNNPNPEKQSESKSSEKLDATRDYLNFLPVLAENFVSINCTFLCSRGYDEEDLLKHGYIEGAKAAVFELLKIVP